MTQSSILCSKPPVAPQVTFAARAFNQICNNIRNSRRRSAAKSYFMRPQLVRKRYNLSPRANFFCGAQLSHKKTHPQNAPHQRKSSDCDCRTKTKGPLALFVRSNSISCFTKLCPREKAELAPTCGRLRAN